jgi:glycosyltransferase involved in cell wall biosynthesis
MIKRHAAVLLFHAKLSPRHELMLRSLKRSGWTISIVAWNRPGSSAIPVGHADCVDHWHWIQVRAPRWGGLGLLTRLPFYYYYLLKSISRLSKPDLWILCHFLLLGSLFFLSGQKLYDASEMYAIEMSLRIPTLRRLVRLTVSLLEGLLVSRVDGVSTVDSREGWLQRFYQRWNQDVQAIWNVPSKLDDPDAEEVNALAEHYEGRKVVAFIGGLMGQKGFRVAIEAAAAVKARHPNALFLFIGTAKDDEDTVYSLIRTNKLGDNVRLLRWLSYRKMLAHLRHARVGLALYQNVAHYPLVSAGNGRKFFSYMQARVPIIGPNFGEVGMAVRMADCGLLVDTANIDEVSEAIIKLLDRPDMTSRMAANGRKAFLEHFNWEKEEQKFLSLVRRITN